MSSSIGHDASARAASRAAPPTVAVVVTAGVLTCWHGGVLAAVAVVGVLVTVGFGLPLLVQVCARWPQPASPGTDDAPMPSQPRRTLDVRPPAYRLTCGGAVGRATTQPGTTVDTAAAGGAG